MEQSVSYFDSLRTGGDDVIRDGASFADYLRPGEIVDSAHPAIVAWAQDIAGDATDRKEKALRLYYAVRDLIRYDPYNTPMQRHAYLASTCLAKGQGYCVNKAGLLAAVLRASGIAARLGYADVRNHMTTKRLTERMGSDTFYYHGYVDVWLGDRWIKATPAFNKELTEKFGLKPLEWDAETDSIYHPFDLTGRRHMQYLAYRGAFADIPFDEIRAAFSAYYPRMQGDGGAVAEGADFAAEGASEAAAARSG